MTAARSVSLCMSVVWTALLCKLVAARTFDTGIIGRSPFTSRGYEWFS